MYKNQYDMKEEKARTLNFDVHESLLSSLYLWRIILLLMKMNWQHFFVLKKALLYHMQLQGPSFAL